MSLKYVDPNALSENVTKTKEHVEAVRSALDTAKQNKMQFSTMPVASADNLGLIVIYTGATSGSYTHGYIYECVSDGQDPATYSWVETPVQDEVAVDGTTITRDQSTGQLSAVPATNSSKGIVQHGDGTEIGADGEVNVVDRLVVTATMPVASESLLNATRLFIGTSATYRTGGIYQCQSDGEATPTYSWVLISTAEVDLSDYKKTFLGTTAEWNAKTTAQKVEFDEADLSDDLGGGMVVSTVAAEGDHNPIESEAVYNLEQDVEANAAAITDLANVYGAKNLLNHDIESGEQSGLTITVNADRSITVSGTASANLVYTLWNEHNLDSSKQYILSGCPSGGSDSKYELTYTDGGYNHYDDIGSGVKFTPFTTGNDKIFLYIFSGQTFNNAVFKPMLRLASITDGTYEPYAKTNRQLTVGLENKADKVSSATDGNFAGLDANGNLTDSGSKASDFATAQGLTGEIGIRQNYNCKNVLPIKWASQTKRGITFTRHIDDSYALSGTCTGNPLIIDLLSTNTYDAIGQSSSFKLVDGIVIDKTKPYILTRGTTSIRFNITLYQDGVSVATLGFSDGTGGTYKEIDFSEYTFNQIKCYARFSKDQDYSAYTFKPMLCLKSDYEFDSTQQAYAKTNQQLTKETTGLLENAEVNNVVNMAPVTKDTYVNEGITFTRNSDDTFTLNGTQTAQAACNTLDFQAGYKLPKGTYKLTGCPKGGGSNTYSLSVFTCNDTSGSSATSLGTETGDGLIFNVDGTKYIFIQIRVYYDSSAPQTLNDVIFKPMISVPSLNLSYDNYVPYGGRTNKGLTDIANKLLFGGTGVSVSAVTDLNTPLTSQGGASFNVSRFINNTTNAPYSGGGLVFTWASSASYGAQLVLGNAGFWFRGNTQGTISSWQKLTT